MSLTTNPVAEIKGIMQFLGVECIPDQMDPALIGNDERSNQKEFEKLNEPINSNSVGCRNYQLSCIEKKLFIRIAGAELAAFDYDL